MLPDYIRLVHFDAYSSNLYFLVDEEAAILIDAHVGTDADSALKSIKDTIGDRILREVILTHWHYDHVGTCPILEEKYHPVFTAHPADAWLIENPWTAVVTGYEFGALTKSGYSDWLRDVGGRGVKIGKLLRDGEKMKVGEVGLQVLHTPGHQHGGISLYDSENKILFCGDTLTPTITFDTWLGYVVDAKSYWETLQTISKLPIETLLPAHEAIREGKDVKTEVIRHIDRFMRVSDEIISILSENDGLSLNKIADTVVHNVLTGRNDQATFTEVTTVHSHLQKLIYEDKVKLLEGIYLIQ